MQGLYRFGAVLLKVLAKISGLTVIGRENIPAGDVPLVVVGNHTSFADPLVLATAMLPRQVNFVAKKEFSEKPLVNWLFKKLGVIFIDRDSSDLLALKKAIAAVREKHVLGIFAEGTRVHTGELGDFKQGTVFIAYKADAPILPVAISNPAHLFCFWKRDAKIVIGEPIYIDREFGKLHDIMDHYTELLKEDIGDMLKR